MRLWAKVLAAGAMAVAGAAGAQDAQTLADIRQELSVLYVEIQRLRRELSTTGNPQVAVGGATALERMDRIEAELRRLTSQTEQMQLRINRIVEDGTNRVGDLEFRLCELEPACDIASLGETPRLGGGDASAAPVVPVPDQTPPQGGGTELAMGEQADFDRARTAMNEGKYRAAADLFRAFTETYPGGPLNAEAHFLRGEALAALGDSSEAGRAYLASYSGTPNGPRAADALLQLAITISDLGQTAEACRLLSEVGNRFPGQAQANVAQQQRTALGCS